MVDAPSDVEIRRVLEAMCDLLAYKELIAQTAQEEYTDMHAILQENAQDICKWVSIEYGTKPNRK